MCCRCFGIAVKGNLRVDSRARKHFCHLTALVCPSYCFFISARSNLLLYVVSQSYVSACALNIGAGQVNALPASPAERKFPFLIEAFLFHSTTFPPILFKHKVTCVMNMNQTRTRHPVSLISPARTLSFNWASVLKQPACAFFVSQFRPDRSTVQQHAT